MAELDEQLIRDACQKVRVGSFPLQSLVMLGVPAHDAAAWLRQGRRRFEDHVSPDEDLLVRLVAALDVAEADLQQAWIASIVRSEKGWQRYEALLEKRWPDVYAERKGKPFGPNRKDNRKLEDILVDLERERDEQGGVESPPAS